MCVSNLQSKGIKARSFAHYQRQREKWIAFNNESNKLGSTRIFPIQYFTLNIESPRFSLFVVEEKKGIEKNSILKKRYDACEAYLGLCFECRLILSCLLLKTTLVLYPVGVQAPERGAGMLQIPQQS